MIITCMIIDVETNWQVREAQVEEAKKEGRIGRERQEEEEGR